MEHKAPAILMDTAGHAWNIRHPRSDGRRGARVEDMALAFDQGLAGHARKIWHPGFRGRARGGTRVLLDSAGPRPRCGTRVCAGFCVHLSPNSSVTFNGAEIELIVEALACKNIHNDWDRHLRRFGSSWLLRGRYVARVSA